ncbi:ribonuclease J [Paenibacillus sp. 1P07SE]|uniref:ribonuclease J n=1 Tax=Paenibacillus sp. 1P07SE TaxID=3132209 RepID=UPI0039A65B4C
MEKNTPTSHTKRSRTPSRSHVKVFALGGLGEIGKNMYGIAFKDEIIIVDAGVKFPRNDLPGVDYIIPSVAYLLEKKDQVKGIFLTHGHEDHIGGLPFILKQLSVPVYGAPLTIGLVRHKLDEHRLLNQAELHVFQEDTIVAFNRIQVEFFRTNHSIPDSFGIAIKTPLGTIVHTGDFKFDLTPVDYPSNLTKMAELGREGVLALLSDSTNSEKPGYTSSEKTVGEAIYDMIRSCQGRVLFATFASNVHRLQQLIEAAERTGRKIAILGRSMDRVFQIGQELGYLRAPEGMIVDLHQLQRIEDSKLIVLCTGSQGEPNAALSRIASGSHRQVSVHPNDTVIFSSSPIPGNTVSINRVIDQLSRSGANVVYGSVLDVHASGHGCQEDLKLMLSLMKPRYLIPIHGEYRMLLMHAQIAEQMGIAKPNIFIMDIGHTVRLSRNQGVRGKNIPSGEMLVTGSDIVEAQGSSIEERVRMSKHGVVFVLMTLNKESNVVLAGPEIISRGFVFIKEASRINLNAAALVRKKVKKLLQSGKFNEEVWNRELIAVLEAHFERTMLRKPLIVPMIQKLSSKARNSDEAIENHDPSRPKESNRPHV